MPPSIRSRPGGAPPLVPLAAVLAYHRAGLSGERQFQRQQPLGTRIREGFAKVLSAMRFPRGGGGYDGSGGGFGGPYGLFGATPDNTVNYARLVGDPALNSAVAICLNWIADQFPEPELTGYYQARGERHKVYDPDHPLLALLDQPTPDQTGDQWWQAGAVDFLVDGNWYLFKTYDNLERLTALHRLPYWTVAPVSNDPAREITHYLYRVDGQVYVLPADQVVHLKYRPDNYRRGCGEGRLTPVLREVYTDSQVASYTAALLKNMGVPAVLIQPKVQPGLQVVADEEARQDFEALWDKFRGDGRGKPLIPSVPLEILPLGLSPEELTLSQTGQEAIRRIAAALGLHPAIVNLGSDTPSAFDTGGQQKEAQRAGYRNCVIPLQKLLARQLVRGLRADYAGYDRTRSRRVFYLGWDYTTVESLSEDVDARHARVRDDFTAGIITRGEARTETGREAKPGDEVYFHDLQLKLKQASPPKPAQSSNGKAPSNGKSPAAAAGPQ